MEDAPLMRCGHVASTKTDDGKWVCTICAGDHRATEEIPVEWMPDLDNREAMCLRCGTLVPSSLDLRMYRYRKFDDNDTFICQTCAQEAK